MKTIGFIVVISSILGIYSLLNYYIIRNGLPLTENHTGLRTLLIWGVVFLAAAFLIGRFSERISVNPVSTTLIWIGSFWLAIMVYLVLQLALIDLVRGLNGLFHFFPAFLTTNPEKVRQITSITVTIIAFLVVLIGHINTWFPAVNKIQIPIDKQAGNLKSLHIVAFSDVHLGTIIEKRHLRGIVNQVNALNPDIILIPGDIIDEDISPVIHTNVGEVLLQLRAKYGVYAVTGNHEYIGGVNKAKEYLTSHGIKLLSDTAVLIDDSFYVVGREDLAIGQFSGKRRKELLDIVNDLDTKKPMILLDHQPIGLAQAETAGIDLQLSGHTHHGQLWPFNYITDRIFEVSRGLIKKGKTYILVSSGIGGWGPPVRTNSRPEILDITLTFGKN
ncbi:MAG: metallophosphoesterase [Bacteroidetes bacterium CG18_big_fil_WC_8_21_14_2_50_41_14]|nr:MAG: metallophosphoesterase [Bacteroidetes bacterium CG18_big_fil_WC_8_21_14_2_50_41_14]PJB59338.1 MAG: metallophosphoesterase [Bacteroidetes bacterium CG_4_9_14_3_um_filter_41_19]